MTAEPQPPAQDAPIRVRSDGGVSLSLPGTWYPVYDDEHLGAFVAQDPSGGGTGLAPVCVISEYPGHTTIDTWWNGVQQGAAGQLLLEVLEHDDGFSTVYALTVDGRSITGACRAQWIPGRTVTTLVQVPTVAADRLLPVARQICSSVTVEGTT